MLLQQVGGDVRADVSGRSGQEYRHVAPLVPVLTGPRRCPCLGQLGTSRAGRALPAAALQSADKSTRAAPEYEY